MQTLTPLESNDPGFALNLTVLRRARSFLSTLSKQRAIKVDQVETPKVSSSAPRALGHLPSLTRDDTHFLAVPVWGDTACLPPLIVRSVDNVEDVSILEAEPLAGEAAVP